MRNDGGGKFPPGPFSSSDSPDSLNAPVAGAFLEGATTVMNDEQRRQALAAAGLQVDPPKAAPKPVSMHDEPTNDPALPAASASFDFGFDGTTDVSPPVETSAAPPPQSDAGFSEPTTELPAAS